MKCFARLIAVLSISFLFALKSRAQFISPAPLVVPDDWIEFEYSTSDGGFVLKCTHGRPYAELNDYQIVCGKNLPAEKSFRAHFLIKRFPRGRAPRDNYQILYWVTDLNFKKPTFSSVSQMLELEERSNLMGFNISVGLENDASMLSVRLKSTEIQN